MASNKPDSPKTALESPSPATEKAAPAKEPAGWLADVFGALKDTVTIAPGTDLTDPVDADWDAKR